MAVSSQLSYSYMFDKYPSKRPPVGERLFTSQAIEDVIIDVKSKLKGPELAWLFEIKKYSFSIRTGTIK